ncbi:hypothetical protein K443DRAFT_14435 [Laccaria amethystina LaAM-08-1]|uniref:Uncharacterized protein n=1 Tax=Laccaria amethystina LaAM-08-1 TaxID=1095629 RepID=A0A0C9X4C7_9AGAR|nr:hypothetical protein K443DRAFT_14435 [Laccaria amethystina LaAM-08-1]
MSEPRKLRSRKLQPVVLLSPVGRGKASTKKGAEKAAQESATDADPGGNVIGKSAPTQATGRPTRSRATKIANAVVNTTVNDSPTPAPSRPSRAKKNNSKAVKNFPASESDPNLSSPMVDKYR